MSVSGENNDAVAESAGCSSGGVKLTSVASLLAAGLLPQQLPKYTGPDQDLDDWVRRLRGLIRSYEVPPAQQAELAINALEGEARKLILHLPAQDQDSIEKILSRLEAVYTHTVTLGNLRARFINRKQRAGESIPQYAIQLQDIAAEIRRKEARRAGRAGWSDTDTWLKDQFVDGILSAKVREKLQEKDRSNPNLKFHELLEAAMLFSEPSCDNAEVLVSCSAERQCKTPEPAQPAPWEAAIHTLTEGMAQLHTELAAMRRERESPRERIPSWKRRSPPQRRLRQERSPSPSGGRQDRRRWRDGPDPAPRESPNPERPAARSQAVGRPSQTTPQPPTEGIVVDCPVVYGSFDGQEIECLLDTGSQVTILPEPLFQRHFPRKKMSPDAPWISLTAANELPIEVVGITWMKVKLWGQDLGQKGVVVTRATGKGRQQVILGMNVIQGLRPELLKRRPSHLEPPKEVRRLLHALATLKDFATNKTDAPEKAGVVRVPFGTEIVVPPRQELVLPMNVGSCHQLQGVPVLVEPLPSDMAPFVARTLTMVWRGTVLIRVRNSKNIPLRLPPGTPIAELSLITGVIAPKVDHIELQKFSGRRYVAKVNIAKRSTEVDRTWASEHILPLLQLSNEELTPAQAEAVRQLVDKWSEVFSQGEFDLGCSTGIEHEISTGESPPTRERYRSIPPHLYQEVKQMLEQMMQQGVIEDSKSPWAAPIVLVRKKDGTLRFCVDYRRLNAVTTRDAYPLPRIEESLAALGKAKFFSTLDLASGYWQIPVAKGDRPKTAFVTPMGLWQFKRMPFGLNNAPATFQRTMEHCLGDMNLDSILIYLDDIVVFSATFADHIAHLDAVLARLHQYGLKLKPKKCHLFKHEIEYLGHVISNQGVLPNPEKITAIQRWKAPTTVTEVRAFLGLTGYYRRFIKHYAHHAAPLQKLLQGVDQRAGHKKVEWGLEQQEAFRFLKNQLMSAPVLAFADFSLPFRLRTDASNQGLGAVLSQIHNGEERVIAYASRSLHPTEKNTENYSSFKLEMLALVWAVTERFAEYLTGAKFEVWTDNNPLVHLQNAKLGALEQRWAARLAKFDFSLHYHPGKGNHVADALSRYPTAMPQRDMDAEAEEDEIPPLGGARPKDMPRVDLIHVLDECNWAEIQKNDPVVAPIVQAVRLRQWPSEEAKSRLLPETQKLLKEGSRLVLKNGVLYRRIMFPHDSSVTWQVVLSRAQARPVAERIHVEGGHWGVQKTFTWFKRQAMCVGLTQLIEQVCQHCVVCSLTKGPEAQVPPMNWNTSTPLEVLTVDFLTLDMSEDGFRHVLVMVDHFTKFAVAVPTHDQTAKTAAQAVWKHFCLPYGCPKKIHSDQGPCFESEFFQEWCRLVGVKKTHTTPYHPQGNGACERFNRTLIQMLRGLIREKRARWTHYLAEVVWRYNHTVHSATGRSPYHVMFGRTLGGPTDLWGVVPTEELEYSPASWIREWKRRMSEVQRFVKDRSWAEPGGPETEAYNLRPGDRVLIRRKGAHQHGKLQTPWEEVPGVVLRQPIPGVPVYDVQKQGTQDRPRRLHRRLLKPIRYGEEALQNSRESGERIPEPSVGPTAEGPWCLLPIPSLRPPTLIEETRDPGGNGPPHECPPQTPTPAVELSDPMSTEASEEGEELGTQPSRDSPQPADTCEEGDFTSLVPEQEFEPRPLRCSQRQNFGRPPERYAQEEFVWSGNLPGRASSSGVECGGVPLYLDPGGRPFNYVSYNPLGAWTLPGGIKPSSSPLPVLSEIAPDGTAVTGHAGCYQVADHNKSRLVCGLPTLSKRARSIPESPSHYQEVGPSPEEVNVHKVGWPCCRLPDPPDGRTLIRRH